MKLLPCPTCKFTDCIRAEATSSVGVEIDSEGDMFEQEDLSPSYDLVKSKLFCSTCGGDLKLEKIKGKLQLVLIPEEIIEKPKPTIGRRIMSRITGTPTPVSRAELAQ